MSDHQELEHETNEVLEAAYRRITCIEPQLLRFARAMKDLGAPVPDNWASQDGSDAVKFGDMTPKAFDRLLCLMEDLASGRNVTVTVMRGGPSLFDPGPPPGPFAPAAPSSVHIVVPS